MCYNIRKLFCSTNQIHRWKDLEKHPLNSNLYCTIHSNNSQTFEPNIIVLYHQNNEESFDRYIITDFKDIDIDKNIFEAHIPQFEKKSVNCPKRVLILN